MVLLFFYQLISGLFTVSLSFIYLFIYLMVLSFSSTYFWIVHSQSFIYLFVYLFNGSFLFHDVVFARSSRNKVTED